MFAAIYGPLCPGGDDAGLSNCMFSASRLVFAGSDDQRRDTCQWEDLYCVPRCASRPLWCQRQGMVTI